MDPRLAAKMKHVKGLKEYASKGIGKDLKAKYMPEAPPEVPEEEADVKVEIEAGDGMGEEQDPSTKPAGECTTEELMALLKERMGEADTEPEMDPV